MADEYNGPDRRRDRLHLEQRLTRLEETQKFILAQGKETHENLVEGLKHLAVTLDGIKDDIGDQAERIAEHTTDISWLKAWLWKAAAGSTAVSTIAAWLLKHMK